MSKKGTSQETAEQHVRSIRRATRKQYSAEEKIRIVLEGLRGVSISSQCEPHLAVSRCDKALQD